MAVAMSTRALFTASRAIVFGLPVPVSMYVPSAPQNAVSILTPTGSISWETVLRDMRRWDGMDRWTRAGRTDGEIDLTGGNAGDCRGAERERGQAIC